MKKGGNAFDAMVATELALVATYAGNLGGGGFMVYRKQMEKGTLDYREKAPCGYKGYVLDAKEMLFLKKHQISLAGVPGTIAGVLQSMQN
jgi:gamma-glutamyltranspeptidase/glutathione hydrolase